MVTPRTSMAYSSTDVVWPSERGSSCVSRPIVTTGPCWTVSIDVIGIPLLAGNQTVESSSEHVHPHVASDTSAFDYETRDLLPHVNTLGRSCGRLYDPSKYRIVFHRTDLAFVDGSLSLGAAYRVAYGCACRRFLDHSIVTFWKSCYGSRSS